MTVLGGPRAADCPRLRPGVRIRADRAAGGDVLLYPEGVVLLNETAAAVVAMIDGTRDAGTIVTELARRYRDVSRQDVLAVLDWLASRHLISDGAG